MRHQYVAALCLFAMSVGACGDSTSQRDDAASLSDEALTQLSREAFTFAYPLMEQYRMLLGLTSPQSPAFVSERNKLFADRVLKGPEDTQVIRPNADTLYGGVFMDLRAEPLVISVPEMDDSRYYSVQLIDAHTHNFGYIGTRTTGNGAGQFMIAGPNWRGETPTGITQVIRTEMYVPLALIGIEVKDEDDLKRVHYLQHAI